MPRSDVDPLVREVFSRTSTDVATGRHSWQCAIWD